MDLMEQLFASRTLSVRHRSVLVISSFAASFGDSRELDCR